MRAADVIIKKRDGGELSAEELNYIVDGMIHGNVRDYQLSALCMAVFFRGMTVQETKDLTLAMANSGERIDLSSVNGFKVDKHSTGGVGDTVSLISGPIIAAAGIPFAKMSGRGLGHTGGTVDKLESIPGLNTSMSIEEFISQVNDIGIAIIGQTANIAPADKILYSLRDVTGTVESLPLISSSIMSKKLAVGADGIVLDVKVGSGAFMKTCEDAKALGRMMVDIGKAAGIKTIAIISDMNQPLSDCVGNALEMKSALQTLDGNGCSRLARMGVEVAARTFVMSGIDLDYESAYKRAEGLLASKAALSKFREMVTAQDGDVNVVDDPEALEIASCAMDVCTPSSGYIDRVDAMSIGRAVMMLGAGRVVKTDPIDLSVGIKLHVSVGDYVEKGDPLATVYASTKAKLSECIYSIAEAFRLSRDPVDPLKLIYDVVE